MNRRQFLEATGSAALLNTVHGAAAQRPPNIVWIMLDDLGSGDVGCYGQEKIQTPNIDRLATEGMKFGNAYSGCTVCAPARSTLMTGLHTGHTPVRGNQGGVPLAADDATVGEMLKKAGYRTGCFGKWGLGDAYTTGVPWKHGFDQFFGYLHQIHAHNYYPEFLWQNERKIMLEGNRNGRQEQYSADVIAEKAYDFIRNSKTRPFFLYAAFTLPHGPVRVPDLGPYAGREWSQSDKEYAAMVTRADAEIGTIMTLLKEGGLDSNTIVFFTSDNGGTASARFFRTNGNLRGYKQDLYEGGIRAPMIARWQGKIKPGSTSDLPWAFWDFLPTAAEIAGVKPRGKSDGISVLPTLLGGESGRRQAGREYLYWEDRPFDFKKREFVNERFSQAVRSGNWKAVRPRASAPVELYDLAADAGETRNLAGDRQELAKKLEALMKEAHVDARPQIEPPHPDAQQFNT